MEAKTTAPSTRNYHFFLTSPLTSLFLHSLTSVPYHIACDMVLQGLLYLLIEGETSLRPLVSVRPLVGCLVVFSALSKKVFVVFVFKIPNYQDKRAKCLSQKCRVYPCSQLWRRTRRRGVKITSRRLKGQLRLLFDTWITTDITTMTYSKTHHVFRYFHFNPYLP